MGTWSGCIPPWGWPSRSWRARPDALIPHEIDRRDARSWVSNPALKMMTQLSLRRPLKYLLMIAVTLLLCTSPALCTMSCTANLHSSILTFPHRDFSEYACGLADDAS